MMTLPVTFRLDGAAAGEASASTGLRLIELRQTPDGLTGQVVDGGTGTPLAGANVTLSGTSVGAATDREGRFLLRTVPEGAVAVQVSFVGFEQITVPEAMIAFLLLLVKTVGREMVRKRPELSSMRTIAFSPMPVAI